MSEIKTVLFDIGNVFVTWDPRFLYQKLIADKDELEYFLKDVVTLEWHTEHDRGRSFAEGAKILTAQFPEYAELISLYNERWNETIGEVITRTVKILEHLNAENIACYALTNFSAEKYPDFAAKNSFTKLFKGVVVSGEEKLVKPDPVIFQRAIDRFSLTPEKTLYVDDRLENVQAAEAKKMQGHHFSDPASLLSSLQALGAIKSFN